VLQHFQSLLPGSGTALDLACGLGANSLFLQERGLETHAWDFSSVAIEKLNRFAAQREILIHTETRDICADPPKENSFDVIVVSHFLDRSLCPAITWALKPGGLLFYQTFTLKNANHVQNPDYLLTENELLSLFSPLTVRAYLENPMNNDVDLRNQAMLVAEQTGVH